MKFRNIVILIIIAILLVAWYTKPTAEDFKKFRESSSTIVSPPLIEVRDGYVYSLYTVSYFNTKKLPQIKVANGEGAIAVLAGKEKYLGLFGKFWRID